MSTTTTQPAILVSHRDGSFYATPEETIEAGLLNGMIEAQRFAARVGLGSVAWDQVTDRFVKGHAISSGQRLVVMWAALPMAVEDELADWIFEHEDADRVPPVSN
jgi:hypothetical protein